jgi:preprotein translocase subunit SecG
MFRSFGVVHIAYLISLPIVIISLYLILKNKSDEIKKIVMLLCILICAAFEFYDMFAYLDYGWKSIFLNLPLYACDLNIFVLGIALFRKGEKRILNKYILYYSITGPIFTLLIPVIDNDIHLWYSNDVIGKFVPHILYVAVAYIYLKFNVKHLCYKKPYEVFLCMIMILSIVHIINLSLIYTGINESADYMFTIDAGKIKLIGDIGKYLGNENKIIRNYFVMFIGYFILTIGMYLAHKTYETQYNRSMNRLKQEAIK